MDLVGGLVVINPYDPHRKTQQWAIIGKQIQNRHDVNNVLQLSGAMDGPGSRITVGEYVGKEYHHWDFRHVYVNFIVLLQQLSMYQEFSKTVRYVLFIIASAKG